MRPGFVVFGGSFDPVHDGHVALVRGLLKQPGVARVLVIPAGKNPLKKHHAQLPPSLRMAMLCAALSTLSGATVLDLELHRQGPSYTSETMACLCSQYPQAELALAIGWDVYRNFQAWQNSTMLLERFSLLVMQRSGEPPPTPHPSSPWLAGLPAPWRDSLRIYRPLTPDGPSLGKARAQGGRSVVEFLRFWRPDISSTHIRRTGELLHVPAPARELLRRHWSQRGQGGSWC